MELVPSPINKDLVPGVYGERILRKLKVQPKLIRSTDDNTNRCYRIMKPIPERNGNFTGKKMFHYISKCIKTMYSMREYRILQPLRRFQRSLNP